MSRAGAASRTMLARRGRIALAELLDGEKETVDALGDHTFDLDPDNRVVPFQVTMFRAALVDADTGELLGRMAWRPIPYGPLLSSTAWNIGIHLLPNARGRGVSVDAGLLLAGHLFATTGVDRVQAITDVDNAAGWRGLERAGFHREGVLRGITLRGGRRRDMVFYSLLRADLEPGRQVFAQRDGVVLARAVPGEHPVTGAPPAASPPQSRGVVLGAATGRLLGTVSWHALHHGGRAAWNTDLDLVPDGALEEVAGTARRLLAEHLFATTEVDRVQASAGVDDLAARDALARAGFRHEGVLRGGEEGDVALYGLLRADLDGTGP